MRLLIDGTVVGKDRVFGLESLAAIRCSFDSWAVMFPRALPAAASAGACDFRPVRSCFGLVVDDLTACPALGGKGPTMLGAAFPSSFLLSRVTPRPLTVKPIALNGDAKCRSIEDLGTRARACVEEAIACELLFRHREEALGNGIDPAVAFTTHALAYASRHSRGRYARLAYLVPLSPWNTRPGPARRDFAAASSASHTRSVMRARSRQPAAGSEPGSSRSCAKVSRATRLRSTGCHSWRARPGRWARRNARGNDIQATMEARSPVGRGRRNACTTAGASGDRRPPW